MAIQLTYDTEVMILYSKMEMILSEFYENSRDINLFYDLSKDIKKLLENKNITYSDLSNQGLFSNHLVNVAILSGKLGISLRVNSLDELILGSLLHDIGKFYINQDILYKKSTLTISERLIIDEHSYLGYKVIRNFIDDILVLNIIKDHHSCLRKLKGTISLFDDKELLPVICSIADITDAMLSYRPYKSPLSLNEVERELKNKGLSDVKNLLDQVIY